MHLLATRPGSISDGSEAVDLQQTPADIIVLSAADTELACLAKAHARITTPGRPGLRLASLLHLGHPMSVDLHVDTVIRNARLVIVRLLGGRSYWPYGVEQISATAREHGILTAFLPGDDQPDPDLAEASSVPPESWVRLWAYLREGGLDNAGQCLAYAASLIGREADWREPKPLMRAGLYWPGRDQADLDTVQQSWRAGQGTAALVFYRALVQAGNLAAVDALIEGLAAEGLNPLPLFVASLKDAVAAATVERVFTQAPPDVILNATGFAVATPGAGPVDGPFAAADCPVLQVIFSGSDEAAWADGMQGLSPRDLAMNVALPEVDGRIITRAVSFKGLERRDEATETDIVTYRPVPDRVAFVARLARAWVELRRTSPQDRRVALVLANYPNQDGRLGNGVGLDVPASALVILEALAAAGYGVADLPADGNGLMQRLAAGPTNDVTALAARTVRETLPRTAYDAFFSGLDAAVQERITARWGKATDDPYYLPDQDAFAVATLRLGTVVIGLQPARGYNIDPTTSYHDPALPPPHAYLAFYAWLREHFGAHAVVHLGKHGNLEWLPGKALALSRTCLPEAAFGPLPHLYPFIVNDPGEGSQAKRRVQAVIIDHLTPPLTRAESYGPLKDLERLVDEYYEAAGVDPRRLALLADEIVLLIQSAGLDRDCGIEKADATDEALAKVDRYLCELKEMQIRDGLHIFGRAPEGTLRRDLLVALARLPRGRGQGGDGSLTRALAEDLDLGFNPLEGDLGTPWSGPCPAALTGDDPWRTTGDTVERLEALAADLVEGKRAPDPAWTRTTAVLDRISATIAPAVDGCGAAEIEALLTGLDGRFVPPGPSGAPTRGRPDVLPTGRNFYAVDTRAVPTATAWTLGWKSAALLVERYTQEHGTWPERMAVTAWGTSNMRTGGDDIAQALALLGVRPTWDPASGRVTGHEILPVSVLGRPRVDVTLRISGFFRDAFPGLIQLFDAAVRDVAALDEAAMDNPVAVRVRAETAKLETEGHDAAEAGRLAGCRVFGSKPGAYGAGLQALIDERGWTTDADLARAYVTWGGYAYGAGLDGAAAHDTFETRLKTTQVVVQNQDNREHDILDSDDYYQFEGGITAAVRVLSGAQPTVYHSDHSRPESPRIRTLEDEVGRVVRARVVNPKWIKGVMRHGYKGAFEMAATVDYLFAFAATAKCVHDHQFDAVYDAYLADDDVRDFLTENNPAALKEMSERLMEAEDRGLWRPRSNAARPTLEALAGARDQEP